MEAILEQELRIDKSTWQKVRFGDVVNEPKETVKDPAASGIQHVIGLEHIDTENIHLRNYATLEDSTTFTKAFKKGDVLFGRRRAYLKKAAQAPFSGICSGDITVFRAKEILLPALLPFIVNNDKFFDYAVKHSAGGLSPRVKFKDLAKFEFLLPPKEQQGQLVELLWTKDELLELERKTVDHLKVLLKTLQSDLFNKEKTPQNRLSYKCDIIGGYAFSSKSFVNEGTPVIKIKNIVNGKIEIKDNGNHVVLNHLEKIEKYRLLQGDILIAMTGATLGKIGVVQKEFDYALLNQRVGKFVPKNKTDKWFLRGVLDSKNFLYELNKYIGEGAQGNISSEDISKTFIPDIDNITMKKVGEKFKLIYRNIEENELRISNSKALQKSLINQIF